VKQTVDNLTKRASGDDDTSNSGSEKADELTCRIGSTVDMFHCRGCTPSITSAMSTWPSSAASMRG
jgi:hypothetical protein